LATLREYGSLKDETVEMKRAINTQMTDEESIAFRGEFRV
jgi:hypothetical protein